MPSLLREPAVLVSRLLECDLAPAEVALHFADDAHPVALVGDWAGGGGIWTSEPCQVAPADADPFALIDHLQRVDGFPAAPGAVGGGWFGYWGYALGGRLERLPAGPAGRRLPAFALAYYDHLVRHDRASGRWWFEAIPLPGRRAEVERRFETIQARLRRRPARQHARAGDFIALPSRPAHEAAVRLALEHIRAGDIFQANLCLRLEADFSGSPATVFAAGVERLQPTRAGFLAGPWGAVASFSPELFLERRGARVRTEPIKGTRRRGGADSAAMRAELIGSEKDRAENVMIVDLMRNDLGRVARPGSVEVPWMLEAQAHPGVWHLVSRVSAEVPETVSHGDLLRATFPPGSVTGCPKIRAMELIADLEQAPREVYTGALGFVSPIAGLELSVVIRTVEFAGGRAWIGVGGGIVADSDPAAEAAECEIKAAPVLDCLRAAGS